MNVEVGSGRVRGIARAASVAFLGIPYADSPTGALRFAAPRPRGAWSGVYDATSPGAIAPQGAVFAPGVGVEGTESEDCLSLNVFTPACDGARRPVMFFVHGGAFTVGTAYMPLYDGKVFAEQHDVVMVSANYRIGALGFLTPADTRDETVIANAGVLDVVLALRWVQEHIERFGGDPGNVTIFGESAGATQVTLLMSHRPARGLFRRAIAQSAMDPLRLVSPETGARHTRTLFDVVGVPRGDYAKLRELPLATIKAAQAQIEADGREWPHFVPVRDTSSLPLAPVDAILEDDAPRVPLIIGYNRDEWNLFDAGNIPSWSKPLDDAEAIADIASRLSDRGDVAARLFETYTASRRKRGLRADARSIVRAVRGDHRFRIGSQEMAARYTAREPDVFAYVFSRESPALRGALAACHALDLPFVFGTFDSPGQDRFAGTGDQVVALSAAMMTAWVSFARGNTPVLPGNTPWPRYEPEKRQTVVFDTEIRVENDPFGEERRAFPV